MAAAKFELAVGNFLFRKGRRMLREMIMTQHELKKRPKVLNPVALECEFTGPYGMDSHPIQPWVDQDGTPIRLHGPGPAMWHQLPRSNTHVRLVF